MTAGGRRSSLWTLVGFTEVSNRIEAERVFALIEHGLGHARTRGPKPGQGRRGDRGRRDGAGGRPPGGGGEKYPRPPAQPRFAILLSIRAKPSI